MSSTYLSVSCIERRLSTGATEHLRFGPRVNLIVGPPNTGKTKWLQTLDYLLGDPGANPFEGAKEEGLAEKYEAAAAELVIGEEALRVERRWREPGVRTKIFVNGEGMGVQDFQTSLAGRLGLPLLHYPKGNPMSGQTWPELSFRMLLRHIHRQQRFWGGIADQQPESEQHACILQFLGLAERLFTEDYGRLINLKIRAERLKARRDQYQQTLDELAQEVLSEPGLSLGASEATVRSAGDRLTGLTEALLLRRAALISSARDQVLPLDQRGRVQQLSEERATIIVGLEELRRKATATAERLGEMARYRTEIRDESDRMARTEDASAILADLRITHCPACDQPVVETGHDTERCFLCNQLLLDQPLLEDLGAVRLRFERDRLCGEIKEADELLAVLERDAEHVARSIKAAEGRLRMLENELAPARQAIASLVQEELSAIDMELGELNERQRQLGRIGAALEVGAQLSGRIADIQRQIDQLRGQVEAAEQSVDFEVAASQMEEGMNEYLAAICVLRPRVWRHSHVSLDVSRHDFGIRVGARRWSAALGGTDTLYFLMAYHYGLLTLSGTVGRHYPGLSIIDLPAEFSGEAVEDKENFIVQPFIDLLDRGEYSGAQLIITGASFAGLQGAHRQTLTDIYVA